MTITEIIEDLERHVAKHGGEEVTEHTNTRDIIAALKTVAVDAEVDALAKLLWKWHDESGAPLEIGSHLRGLAAWLVAKGVTLES